jgi:hypothetical protein
MYCRQQVAQLRQRLHDIRARNADLVVIGNGSMEQAKTFKNEYAPEIDVYTDPSRKTYRTLGMKRSVMATIGPMTWKNAINAIRQGFRQGALQGDPWQLGGIMVTDPSGEVLYKYLSKVAGDHPDPMEIISKL